MTGKFKPGDRVVCKIESTTFSRLGTITRYAASAKYPYNVLFDHLVGSTKELAVSEEELSFLPFVNSRDYRRDLERCKTAIST